MKIKYAHIYVHNPWQRFYFNFVFGYNFKLTEKFQESSKNAYMSFTEISQFLVF